MEDVNLDGSYTLYDLFAIWGYAPYPHIAVLILAAICVEAYCLEKGGAKECSVAIVGTILTTGITSLIMAMAIYPAHFYVGDRMAMPWTYYAAFCGLILAVGLIFAIGFKKDLAKKRYTIAFFQGSIFILSLIVLTVTFAAPYRVDRNMEKWEKALSQEANR